EPQSASVLDHCDVQVAITIEIGVRRTPSEHGIGERAAHPRNGISEVASPIIQKKKGWLTKTDVIINFIHLRRDVTIGHEQIEIPVEVDVEEEQSERK